MKKHKQEKTENKHHESPSSSPSAGTATNDIKESTVVTSDVQNEGIAYLAEILGEMLSTPKDGQDDGIIQGLKNIASMVPFSPEASLPTPISGMGVVAPGIMGFRRQQKNLNVAVVGGKAPVFYLPLDKLIPLVELMHIRKHRTVVIQNCSDGADGEFSRGQILARFNPEHSALHVTWGLSGRVIRVPADVAKPGVYYVNREALVSFYLAAKAQLKGGNQLEELLRANEGWREYDIPTNPLDPGGE